MKHRMKYIVALLVTGMVFTACENLFDVDSDRYMSLEKNKLNNPGDSFYSLLGILKQLRDLNDKYVVLNELRGDLMDVSEYADIELQDINHFKADISNPWIWARDYYTVINSCNYLIDRTGPIGNTDENPMLLEVVQAKTIRAWVYLQLLSNYGKAIYLEKPVVTLEDAQKQYTFSGYDVILPKLIEDMKPWAETGLPRYGSIGSVDSDKLMIDTRFVLGDLYLWNRNYREAAQTYYSLIREKSLVVSDTYRSSWNSSGLSRNYSWNAIFSNTDQIISMIVFDESFYSRLYSLTGSVNSMLVPSENYMNLAQSQIYSDFFIVNSNRVEVTKEGDLRGEGGAYSLIRYTSTTTGSGENVVINKYNIASGKRVYLYRRTQLYLRYAEAVNQLNKPTLALAILNEGLNARTTSPITGNINVSEITPLEPWMNFTSAIFDSNIGTRQRGLGMNASNFIAIPPFTIDSIGFVERALRDELALEMAFEGCRFPDLMRMARHRNNPSLLADAVAEKHPANKEAMRAFLMQEKNWYLPYPEK